MWLLVFAVLALIIGADLRKRGNELSYASVKGASHFQTGQSANAIGAWIGLFGGIVLNIAVWHLF
jgi:hypothetical protein